MATAPAPGVRTFGAVLDFAFVPSVSIMAKSLIDVGKGLHSMKDPLTEAVHKVMIPSITKNFDSEGRPAWQSLSESTLLAREYEGYGDGPILDRTGDLKAVATSADIWTITDQSATVRDLPPDVWYGKIHQEGAAGSTGATGGDLLASFGETSFIGSLLSPAEIARAFQSESGRHAVDIPARPFIMFQPEDVPAIERVFDNWLGKVVSARWG